MTRLLPWLALIALLVQAAIPAGLMPDFTAKGPGLHLTICDGVMPAADHPMPGMDMPAGAAHGQNHGKAPPCPYAMAAALWFTLALLIVLLWLPPESRALSFFYRRTPRRPSFGNAAPRAPPFL